MRCYYCDGHATDVERLRNTNIPVCDDQKCKQEFWEAKEEQKDRDRKYDEWRTRSE